MGPLGGRQPWVRSQHFDQPHFVHCAVLSSRLASGELHANAKLAGSRVLDWVNDVISHSDHWKGNVLYSETCLSVGSTS